MRWDTSSVTYSGFTGCFGSHSIIHPLTGDWLASQQHWAMDHASLSTAAWKLSLLPLLHSWRLLFWVAHSCLAMCKLSSDWPVKISAAYFYRIAESFQKTLVLGQLPLKSLVYMIFPELSVPSAQLVLSPLTELLYVWSEKCCCNVCWKLPVLGGGE